MLWVRFPNGQCIQYNRATYCLTDANCQRRLFPSRKDGDANTNIIAIVPRECIVEFEFACAVTNPLAPKYDDAQTAKELRSIKRKLKKP